MRIEFGSPRGFLNWYARDGDFGRDRLLPNLAGFGGWFCLPVSAPWFERWNAGAMVYRWAVTVDAGNRIISWRAINADD